MARQKLLILTCNIDLITTDVLAIHHKLYQSHHQAVHQLPANGSNQLTQPQQLELTRPKARVHQRFKICQILLSASTVELVYS